MERLKDKLNNYEYWNTTLPPLYDITSYDLKLCQTLTVNKQCAHKALATDIESLRIAFPDNREMIKSLGVIERKLANISKDKINVNFWKSTAPVLLNEQMNKATTKAKLDNTAREVINATARDTFGLDQESKDVLPTKRRMSLRSDDNEKQSKKQNIEDMTEVDGVKINDNDLSIGTIIKREAIKLFIDKTDYNSRKYKIMTNGLSSILDLCDITETSQKSLFLHDEWNEILNTYNAKYTTDLIPIDEIIVSTWKIVTHNIMSTRDIDSGLKYLYQIYPKHLKKNHFFWLKLCEHLLNLIQKYPRMLIKCNPPAFSENDYLRIIWSNFFELLFPPTGIIQVKTGETTYYKSTENKAQQYAGTSSHTSKIIGFKIDVRFLIRHNNHDIDICSGEIACHDGDDKIIYDEGKLNREAKDILDNIITIIPKSKANISMGWSMQVSGSCCFFSCIYLDANGLYVKVPKFEFVLPSSVTALPEYIDVLSKFSSFRQSLYCIADTIEESLAAKHSIQTALGRGLNKDNDVDPRVFWMRDSYYTPPTETNRKLPNFLFGCPPPPSIMDKLRSLNHEKIAEVDPVLSTYRFDENGWALNNGVWYNVITKEKQTSSPYEDSDDGKSEN